MKYNKKKYLSPQLDSVQLMSNVSLMENSGETDEYLSKKTDFVEENIETGIPKSHSNIWDDEETTSED